VPRVKEKDTADLAHFFSELQRETDRGLPLVAAALLDEKLLEALQSFLCIGKSAERLLIEPNAPLGTLSSRIEACFSLGLIDEFEYQEISLIRKIRNVFAHSKHGLSFSNEKIMGLCASLKSDLPQDANYPVTEARFRFINATVCLVLRLYYRGA
jgi:mannitol operon repressor